MTEEVATPTELPPDRVQELVESGEAELIDVRLAYEWEAGRLAGAQHVEMNELAARAGSIPRDRPVVFYCRTGNRSGMATDAFRQAGYNAYNLAGGIVAWVERGLPLDSEGGGVAPPRPI